MRKLTFLLFFCATLPHFTHQDNIWSIDDGVGSLFDAYRAIEEAMTRDTRIMFQLKQAFFPSVDLRYWQVDGVDVIPINVNISLLDRTGVTVDCNFTSDSTMMDKQVVKRFTSWHFQWTNSLLMNNIPGDVLLAMDPVFTAIIYSNIVESSRNRVVGLQLGINKSSLFCTLSEDSFEQALALFLSRVSHKNTYDLKSLAKYFPIAINHANQISLVEHGLASMYMCKRSCTQTL